MQLSKLAACLVLTVLSLSSHATKKLESSTQLYVGVGASNNGTVTNDPAHLNDTTKPIGFSIDEATAEPASAYVEIFAGTDTPNNKVVSKDENFRGGSTESIGVLSTKPIRKGTKLYVGTGTCNNGEVTNNTRHKGCATKFLGYTMPAK